LNTYNLPIKDLKRNQVYVFTSNLQGFHGAGSAGYASFGVLGNHWREYGYADKPIGWKGKWNVKGCHQGLQQGEEGWSYALPTVTRPGAKKSLTLDQIYNYIVELYETAKVNPEWEFLLPFSGKSLDKTMLNGYTLKDFKKMIISLKTPINILFEENFYKLIEKEIKWIEKN
jgi:hypothetical protein